MTIDVTKFVKESLKLKGGIDIKKDTAEKLKILEKNGVQINLLLGDILDGLAYDEMMDNLGVSDNKSDKKVSENLEDFTAEKNENDYGKKE